MMRSMMFGLLAATVLATADHAQTMDPEMTCADYMKSAEASGETPRSGDAAADKMAAEAEARMKAYCQANPKAKAMDAAMKAMGG